MIPYFLILILILFCAILDNNNKKNSLKKIVFVILALFAGLRYGVGIDYFSYIEVFENETGNEPGRILLIQLSKKLGGSGQLYIFFMAIITEFFAYKTLIKYERADFWFITIVFYCISLFYIASFNASRQYMAIAAILWGLQFVEKSKWKFLAVSLMAGFGFHFSALLFVPLYYFIKRKHSIILLLVILICIPIISKYIFMLLSYTPYAKYEMFLYNDDRENQVHITHYLLATISFLLLLCGNRFKNFAKNTILYNMNVLCLYSLVLVIIQDIPTFIMLFQRINNYFVYSYLLIIPAILSSLRPSIAKMSKLLIVLFSIGYLILTVVVKGEHHMIVPYDINVHLFNFL